MKGKKKWLLLLIIPVIFVIIILSFIGIILGKMKKQLERIDTTPVDIAQVADGIYTGESETELVKVAVNVTVKDGKIENIDILKHECGKGKPAERIIESIIQKNNVEVDAVSGATVSSAVIQDAVRTALRKGIKER